MTIAASIMCHDGMILCADTEETISDERKGHAPKIEIFHHYDKMNLGQEYDMGGPIHDSAKDGPWMGRGSDALIGVSGAGHAEWIAAFIQGMYDAVIKKVQGQKFNWQVFQGALSAYAEGFFEHYIKSYAEDPNHRPQAHMLVITQTKQRLARATFKVHENVVLDPRGDCVAVGTGGPLFQYLAGNLLRADLRMRKAASIAAYILKRVKNEVRGCGGNSHIVLLGSNGTIETLSTHRVLQLEMQQTELEAKWYAKFARELWKNNSR